MPMHMPQPLEDGLALGGVGSGRELGLVLGLGLNAARQRL